MLRVMESDLVSPSVGRFGDLAVFAVVAGGKSFVIRDELDDSATFVDNRTAGTTTPGKPFGNLAVVFCAANLSTVGSQVKVLAGEVEHSLARGLVLAVLGYRIADTGHACSLTLAKNGIYRF